jgi:hypothetical protein
MPKQIRPSRAIAPKAAEHRVRLKLPDPSIGPFHFFEKRLKSNQIRVNPSESNQINRGEGGDQIPPDFRFAKVLHLSQLSTLYCHSNPCGGYPATGLTQTHERAKFLFTFPPAFA